MDDTFEIKKINVGNKQSGVTRMKAHDKPKTTSNPNVRVSTPLQLKKKRKIMKILKIGAIALVVLVVIILVGVVLPMRKTYAKAQETAAVAREAMAAVEGQNIAEAGKKLSELDGKVKELKDSYAATKWVGFVPVVGWYYRDGEHGLNAADEFVKAGQIAVEAITPYADLLGLTEGEGSFVDQPADKRIETAVKTFEKVTPKLGEISKHLAVAKEEIDAIDPNRYPTRVGNKEVRPRIVAGKQMVEELVGTFINAQPLLEILPEMMGEPEAKRYLILFQNDKELRATGGFLTAYAIFRIEHGKILVEESEDIYKLDARQVKRIQAPDEILKFHKGVPYANIRDSNISPDFYESMKMFEELMQTISDPEDYDGIIAVDTHVLVATMQVLDGEIFVPEYGTKFTVQPDDRCDGCPQVVYELEEFADQAVGHVREDRKDILGRLMLNIMQKALGVSPSQYWGRLMQAFIQQINEKHIIAYMHDERAQKAIEALNFGGRIKEYEGDYLHINDVNFAGAKSNMYVKHFVTQSIDVGSDGKITKTISIDYKNPSQPSNCNLEAGKLCLNAELRNWLRVYVPKGSKLISMTGADEGGVKPETKEELGKTVFEGFLTVRPLGSAHVEVKYELPFKAAGKTYKLFMQKQPGTAGHEYTIKINDHEVEKFNLTTDREVEYKI